MPKVRLLLSPSLGRAVVYPQISITLCGGHARESERFSLECFVSSIKLNKQKIVSKTDAENADQCPIGQVNYEVHSVKNTHL
jgi:hypothetical protein